MDRKKEEEKRTELRTILYKLAENKDVLASRYDRENMYLKLENLYDKKEDKKCFWLYYSDIFSILIDIKQNQETLGDINVLGDNLSTLRSSYNIRNKGANDKPIDITDTLNYLYDFVKLEIARISYFERDERKLAGSIQLLNMGRGSDIINEKQKKTQVDDEKQLIQQCKNITILRMFAAIILPFLAVLFLIYCSSN